MKKILALCLAAILTTASVSAAPVAEKILKIFSTAFPEVTETTWYNYESFYAVFFKNPDGSTCRIEYDPQGNVLSTIRYYSEEALSPFIRAKVNEKYPRKQIFGITEISSGEELSYHIVLED